MKTGSKALLTGTGLVAAFALFFGENPPHTADAELRNRLLGI